jgi:hypothetical protein
MPEIKYDAQKAFANNAKAQSKGSKHVFVLMDESGSMSGLEEAVTTGCNEFIHSFAEDPDAKIWLAWFDHSPGQDRTRFKVRGEVAADVQHLGPGDYSPRGTTPLNDAIADTVAALDAAAGDDENVFLAIITDGYENASEHSTESIRRLLSAREEKGWGIVFLGANQNAVQTAAEFGMTKPGRAFNFDASDEKVRTSMKNVSDVAKLRMEKEAGLAGRELYDEEVAAEFARRGGRIDGEE